MLPTPTTSPRQNVQRSAFNVQRSPRAFTIIEIIVVVTIIIALVAILVPTIGAARRAGNKSANVAQLSALQAGLQQYFSDFNLYPPSSPLIQPANTTPGYTPIVAGRGAAMLAEALMGYLNSNTPNYTDGAGTQVNPTDPRFGFRTRGGALGKIYGPYVSDNPKTFKVNIFDTTVTPPAPLDAAFIDVFGHEILYFASTQQGNSGLTTTANITSIFGTPATPVNSTTINYYFNDSDNTQYYAGTTIPTSPRVYTDGSTTAPLPTAPVVKDPVSPTNKGPTVGFFQLLANRPSNSLTTGAGPVLGSNSFLLISMGEDGNPYTDDDVVATNR